MNLLQKYYPGIAKVSPELAQEVIDRSGRHCECSEGCRMLAQEIHHVARKRRVAHLNNLKHLSIDCHKVPNGVHGNIEFDNKMRKEYQDWCFEQGYSEDEVRYLLGFKDMRLL
jgi:hypothetical protein